MKELNKIKFYEFSIIWLIIVLGACNAKFNRAKLSNSTDYDPKINDDYSLITDISNYKKWGSYNVHDPSCIKDDKYYYVYSTDAIYWSRGAVRNSDTIHVGNIQVRRSKDLIHWEFLGWAFDSIPSEAIEHVVKASGGKKPNGIWAPYIMKSGREFRLYYAVSIFGANTSFIGLATSTSPEGPWKQSGCVVKTFKTDPMNAIDPTVAIDSSEDKQWMIYGSYFGGIYCVRLDPKTGLAMKNDDKGFCIARRSEGKTRIIEAPEVIYNPEQKKYYLFVSYDALFTHYNVRVGRSDKPEGPYLDYFGNNLADTSSIHPVITYAYRFRNHPGWAGVGHCSIINDNGNYYIFHQGRLAPDNLMMVLHVRKIFWTPDGWPVISPERFAGIPETKFAVEDIQGKWENIKLSDIPDPVKLWQGQIPPGGWKYDTLQFNNSTIMEFLPGGKIQGQSDLKWELKNDRLILSGYSSPRPVILILSSGWDWENRKSTIVFTGLNSEGYGIWGKKVN